VPRAKLVAKGYGRSRALVSTVGPARKREKNRRVDFDVLEMDEP
jgi:outer membrane protein OmpA-like peptidoglycan-associated protein